METLLLRTKVYVPPARVELVSRPHLIERLNSGLWQNGHAARKLTLISAPAGFGKTTLVAAWTRALGEQSPPVAAGWLSLDESDNDPIRFLTYLIAALQTAEPAIGHGVLATLRTPHPPPVESVLTGLINEIAALPNRIVLVLDDYHLIDAQPIRDTLTFLLRHMPPQLHIVIATREDPLLSLARLRARGQVTELRAADLRFASAEAVEFLNQVMGLDLSVEDIAALETRTEGWIAGLQLAAISMRGQHDTRAFIHSFTGSHRFVLDYLIEEVLRHQKGDIQDFLLQTAILDRLTAPLCDTITGRDDSQAILDMLERANLFIIPLDHERCWYRYHHLFGDLLNERLHQTQPEHIGTLHHRASVWFEHQDLADGAIEHGLQAEAFERAARLIAREADAIWESGEHAKYRRWLDSLPVEVIFSEPILCTLHAETQFARGQMHEAIQGLQAAEQTLSHVVDIKRDQLTPDQLRLRGRIAADSAQIAVWRGDVPATIQHARRALDLLPEHALPWRSVAAIALGDAHSINGDMVEAYQAQLEALEICRTAGIPFLLLIANANLAVTQRQRGHLQQALDTCQRLSHLAHENNMAHTVVVGWCLAIWGELLAERNDLDGAIDKAGQGVELAERYGDVGMLSKSYLCLLRVVYTRGDISNAQEILQKLENIAQEADMPSDLPGVIAAWQARIWLAQGRSELAGRWVNDRGVTVNDDLTYLRQPEYIALARILIHQEQWDDALELLQQLQDFALAGGRTSTAIEILLLRALALQAQGNMVEATSALEHALTLAEPGGFVRVFVDEGPPVARLLYDTLTHGDFVKYKRRLLAAFPDAEPAKVDVDETQSSAPNLIEPLSDREIEVLELIAEGWTNPEIAGKLFLSLYTIKSHCRNIYGKLDVHNRISAVARAKALGILDLDV
jgi:LuxR family maltose regulon positive regulatory protein